MKHKPQLLTDILASQLKAMRGLLREAVYSHHLVDLPRGYVVVTSQLDVQKSLIVSKVQVHL